MLCARASHHIDVPSPPSHPAPPGPPSKGWVTTAQPKPQPKCVQNAGSSADPDAAFCSAVICSVVIADTPWYRFDSSGLKMIHERTVAFAARYGTPSNSINSLEYLTDDRLHRMETCFGIKWQIFKPFYGIRWSLRPLLASLKGRREPSRFRIYLAKAS